MVRILILASVIVTLSSCSVILNCDFKSPNSNYKSDIIKIQKLRLIKNKLLFEIANESNVYLHLPSPITIDYDVNNGRWFLNNDVFSTSVGISIDIIEIKPRDKQKFSFYIPEKYKTSYDQMKIHLFFGESKESTTIENKTTNMDFLEYYDNNIKEVFWVLENCTKH